MRKGAESQPQITTQLTSPLPLDPSYRREDFDMEDGADECIAVVVGCVLPRPKTAENPSDVDGSPPRMHELRLLA